MSGTSILDNLLEVISEVVSPKTTPVPIPSPISTPTPISTRTKTIPSLTKPKQVHVKLPHSDDCHRFKYNVESYISKDMELTGDLERDHIGKIYAFTGTAATLYKECNWNKNGGYYYKPLCKNRDSPCFVNDITAYVNRHEDKTMSVIYDMNAFILDIKKGDSTDKEKVKEQIMKTAERRTKENPDYNKVVFY